MNHLHLELIRTLGGLSDCPTRSLSCSGLLKTARWLNVTSFSPTTLGDAILTAIIQINKYTKSTKYHQDLKINSGTSSGSEPFKFDTGSSPDSQTFLLQRRMVWLTTQHPFRTPKAFLAASLAAFTSFSSRKAFLNSTSKVALQTSTTLATVLRISFTTLAVAAETSFTLFTSLMIGVVLRRGDSLAGSILTCCSFTQGSSSVRSLNFLVLVSYTPSQETEKSTGPLSLPWRELSETSMLFRTSGSDSRDSRPISGAFCRTYSTAESMAVLSSGLQLRSKETHVSVSL